MEISDLGLSSEYTKVCELMFDGDVSSAYALIEKYTDRKELIPLLCIAAVESLWRNEESDRSWDFLRPLITPAQEECLRESSCYFVWWGIFSLRLAESVKADSDFPLAPFWKEIILLAFFKSGYGGGTCYNYGLLSVSVILDHILIKQYYLTDLNDFFLEDLLDELSALKTDTLNLTECPLTKTSFKTWSNPEVKSVYIWPGIPYRAMRVLKKAFPDWSETGIKQTAAEALNMAEESKRLGSQEESVFFAKCAMNLLRLMSSGNRKTSYYKMRRKAYRLAGREKTADYISVKYGIP